MKIRKIIAIILALAFVLSVVPAFAATDDIKLIQEAEASILNKIEMNDGQIGVITSGTSYLYAKEALGDSVSYLKLGIVNPLPSYIIRSFCKKFETVYVIEELDDIIETQCKKLGCEVIGKEIFGFIGELSQSIIREKIKSGEIVFINVLATDALLPLRCWISPAIRCEKKFIGR